MSEIVSVIAISASVFMGLSIGASSVAAAFGPVNSARSANVLRSALLAGIFAFAGAVLQGGNVANRVGSGLLAGQITTLQAAVILLVGAALVLSSVYFDYPMPTAFTVVGAVVGAGLGFGNAVQLGSLTEVVGYWLLIPPLAAVMGYMISRALRATVSREDNKKAIRLLLLATGSYVAYTAGANSVGLAVGPLGALIDSSSALLLLGGLSILMGAWLYSPRIIRAVSFDYSNIGPRRSIASLGTAALLAQVGIFLGIPISFNEAVISAVIGSGMVEGRNNTEPGKIIRTAAAWIGAFLLAAALTFAAGVLFTL
jgi:PiT family inorganic phosphate transporter